MAVSAIFCPVAAYRRYSDWLKDRFGAKVRKITVDAGFSCPNRDGTLSNLGCSFCDNEAFSPAVAHRGESVEDQVRAEIDRSRAQGFAGKFLVYFQPFTNTHGSLEKLRAAYEQAFCHQDVAGMAVGTRPDCLDQNKVALLREFAKSHYVSVEIGAQSANDDALKAVNRGHTFKDTCNAAALCRAQGLDICFHVILGLPGDGREGVRKTAVELAKLDYQSLKIHNLHVCQGTLLEQEFKEGKIALPSFDDHVSWTVDFLERTPESVTIQRLMGDAPADHLVAPQWCLEKQKVLKAVEEEFERRGSRQGMIQAGGTEAAG